MESIGTYFLVYGTIIFLGALSGIIVGRMIDKHKRARK